MSKSLVYDFPETVADDRPKYPLPVLVIDFDGTLMNKSVGWKGMAVAADPPTDGAMDFLRQALDHFTVFIHSARSATTEGRRVMHSWLLNHYGTHHGLTFDQAAQELKAVQWPVTKPHAHVLIDDRAVQFVGTWPDVQYLKNFQPWNRK